LATERAKYASAIDSEKVTRPVFIVGLNRTGTTLLHRLLAADSATFRAPYMYEMMCPIDNTNDPDRYARPPSRDPRYLEVHHTVEMAKDQVGPSFQAIHPTAAHLPEEEFFFFEGSFLSHTYAVMAHAGACPRTTLK
jgi:hypothetical protein